VAEYFLGSLGVFGVRQDRSLDELVFVYCCRMWCMGSAELVAQLNATLDALAAEVTSDCSALASASVLAGALEMVGRRVESLSVSVVDEVDRHGLFGVDGHSTAIAWSAFTCRTSRTVAARRVRAGRLFRHLTTTRDLFGAGAVGVEQVDLLARLHANPRCGHELAECEALLLEHAQQFSFPRFNKCTDRWLELADADGAERNHRSARTDRHLSLQRLPDGRWRVTGSYDAVDGETLNETHQRFTETERLADWAAARAEHGDNANQTHLPRTERQRRADALVAMAVQAASTPADAQAPEPVVNIIMTNDAFEAAAAAYAGATTVAPRPATYPDYRCETVNGGPVSPAEAFRLALLGHVRRVVFGTAEASVSRRARLFTGPLRKLLDVRDGSCTWAGCDRPPRQCQGGHLEPFRDDGETTAANGGLECGPHNRFKDRHRYKTWRDPNGTWHTYRPDGTELHPAA
jgi:hypothetical protein